MTHVIVFVSSVLKDDIPHINTDVLKRIRVDIGQKLTTRPVVFGKPLRQSLRGYRSLRTGDYRTVYRIDGNLVRIVAIRHRRDVYKVVVKRI